MNKTLLNLRKSLRKWLNCQTRVKIQSLSHPKGQSPNDEMRLHEGHTVTAYNSYGLNDTLFELSEKVKGVAELSRPSPNPSVNH